MRRLVIAAVLVVMVYAGCGGDDKPTTPPTTGSCCVNGTCTVTTQASCSGPWTAAGVCEPNPCEQPPPPVVEGGSAAASVWYFDSASLDGRVLVRWSSGRAGWNPDSDWPPSPSPPAVGAVRLLVSRQGVDRGFTTAAFHAYDGADSAWVEGLTNGMAYYFRIATYDSTRSALLGYSTPIMTMPGPAADIERVVASGLLVRDVTATWSPDGGRIAFVRPALQPSDGYRGNICVFDLASGVEHQLSVHADEDRVLADVAWSPDGSGIAYCYSPTDMAGSVNYRIWLTPSAEFVPEAITAGRVDFGPAWSADGSIVFCRGGWGPPNIPELWSAERGSWTARQLTRDQSTRKRHPSVHPTTGLIVFGGEDVHNLRQHLYTLDPAGGGPVAVPSNPYWSDTEPVWAPGGNRVLMSSDRSGHVEIWSLDLGAGLWRQITRGPERRVERSGPEVSPDGMHLAFREVAGYGWRGSLLIAPLVESAGP